MKKKIELGVAPKELVHILGAELINAHMEGCQFRTSLDDLVLLVVGEVVVPGKGEAFKARARRRYNLEKLIAGGTVS